MDRQAFRNRMQQLKQYREQNPGKTYLDFKKYADGGETGEKNWYNSLTKEQKNRIVSTSNYISDDQARTLGNTYPATAARELQSGSFAFDAGELPQVDIKPTQMYAVLNTYYPFISKYSKTGHSELITPAGRTISTGGSDKNYNLFCNNCSDATGAALQKAFNKKLNSKLFTTPGDVKDFAEDLGAIYSSPSSKHNQKGAKTQFIPVDIKQARELEFQADSIYRDGMGMPIQSREEFWSKPEKYAEGGEIPPSNKPIIPEEPQPYKGKLYKDRYGRKYTEDQMNEYYDSSTDEIDRFTGKPFIRGLKPVGDIEDAANATPVGDAISAYDTYKALKNKDWEGAGLAAMGLIPFMPMTVKQFRSKYKGITPKQKYKAVSHDYNTSVNRNYVQDRIDEALAYDAAVNSKLTQAKNQTYNVVERLMDDPSYIERAKQVKTQFGDDYIQAYADIINLYNENPLELPNVERLNSGNSRARMQRNSNGTYSYKLDPDIADISAPVTEHELSHYADFKRNLDRPDPHGDSNMFYQMKKDISGRKIDSRDDYYSLPTEQKAHMNQLREYMFQNNYISTRGETVDEKLLKKAIQEADKLDSMRGVARASRQFKSFNKYTKWFNSIPLLGIGAAAVYNNNQE